jgi:hypothetical protein
MNHNRAYAVRCATATLLAKPGRPRGLRKDRVAATFWIALDWGTYRNLTEQAQLTPDQFQQWLRWHYRSTLRSSWQKCSRGSLLPSVAPAFPCRNNRMRRRDWL